MGSTPRLCALLLGLLSCGIAQAATEMYCCQDASNRRACADTLPEQCRGRAYRVLDSAGNVIKEVGPPMTAEQKAELAVADKKRKEQEATAREQRRRDQALLDTYATLGDIDLAQQKAEADVRYAMDQTTARIDVARTRHKKLDNEAEFYKKKALPPELEKELRALDHELKVQQELLDVKKKEFDTIRSKYDADRRRYIELTNRRPLSQSPR